MAKVIYKNGVTSVITRVKLLDSASTTGAAKTGLTNASSGLIISTIADVEASATVYTSAGSLIDTITTLGTFAAPTATHCRFKEVDATNHPGIYEIHIADARWAVSNARSVIVTVQCTGVVPVDAEIQLSAADLNDAVALGLSRLDAAISSRMATFTLPTNFSTFSIDGSGRADVGKWLGTAVTAGTTAGKPDVVVITNNDKTGYTASTVSDKTGYSLTQAFPTNFSSLSIDASGRVTLVPSQIVFKKNVAFNNFQFLLISSADDISPATGVTVTAQRSIDGAAFAACANSVTELANGIYNLNLAATDLNGNIITLKFTGTSALARFVTIVTQP